jgi:glycosyltransferase involved in cell wall biosynthesis
MQSEAMAKNDVVYLCVWSGDEKRAMGLVRSRWAKAEIKVFPYRRLRESGFRERMRLLWGFRGRAVVFCFQSLREVKHEKILECTQFFHRCQQTVLCDESGRWNSVRTVDILRAAPGVLFSILLDIKTLIFWQCYLRLWLWHTEPVPAAAGGSQTEIAYLIPNPRSMGSGGGAISHIRGFLYALKAAGTTCRVFSGTALAQDAFENEIIAAAGRRCFFSGAAMLSYNFEFARGVQKYLGSEAPGFLYQRHFPFSIAGALLSRRLKVPLILEYNGSEAWIANYWDPNPLRNWIRMCEEVMLRCAARIVVVSEALKSDLLDRGIQPERIRVNPNGVDASYFYPGCGRTRGRKELDIKPDEVLVGFVGSFSLWHGIEILQQAIIKLSSLSPPCRLRFVLMGNGLLHAEMRSALAAYEISGEVIFTGPLPHDKVAEYLDASDILVSPHIPMPDGSRFFGSPTKLFEYMAMGKGIVASRLEQLAEVLEHDQTAWLVTPGDVDELAEAILGLAHDPAKRQALGAAARRAAIERHSWTQNVAWALSDIPFREVRSSVASEDFHEQADGSTLLP